MNEELKEAKDKHSPGFTLSEDLMVNGVEILKQRIDAETACDKDLHDEDSLWMNTAISFLGCMPPFFKGLLNNMTSYDNHLQHPDCINNSYVPFKNEDSSQFYQFRKIAKMYKRPCIQMTTSTSLTETSKRFVLTF